MKRDKLKINEPCHENWNGMSGDEKARHCGQCDKDVHHISAMTEQEATALLAESCGQNICVRYRCEEDGNIQFKAPEPARSPRFEAQLRGLRTLVAASAMAFPLLGAFECTPGYELLEPPPQEDIIMGMMEVVEPPAPEVKMGKIAIEAPEVPKPLPKVELEIMGDVMVPDDLPPIPQ